MTTAGAPSTYFPSIDILRGFAAVSMVVYHVIEHYQWTAFPQTGPLSWFRIGWMSVDLFFVISGFVIGLSAFSGIDRHGAEGFRRPFIRRRLSRIVPLHYLTCAVYVFFVARNLVHEGFLPNALAHALFIHNWFPSLHGAINGVNWSLGAEMQFYVLMLVFAPWIRITPWWQLALIFTGIAWLWRLGVTVLVPLDSPFKEFLPFAYATQLPGMLDEFLVGLLLARIVNSERGQAFLAWIGRGTTEALASTLVVVLVLWGVLSFFWRHASFWDVPHMAVFFRTVLASAFGLVILVACGLNSEAWLKVTAPLRYFGTISYGIYLWHLPVLLSWKKWPGIEPAQALPLVMACTVLLSAMSWHAFEKPFIGQFGPPSRHGERLQEDRP